MQGRARARKGEAQGVLSYQKVEGSFDNPHIYYIIKYTYDIYIYIYVHTINSSFVSSLVNPFPKSSNGRFISLGI